MAEGSSSVLFLPKDTKVSFVKPPPEDLDVYCKKCHIFMQNPHQTSCCGVHICKSCQESAKATCHFCPPGKYVYNAFPDRAHQRRITALEVHCIHRAKQCEWSGKLEDLSAHLNYREKELFKRYEGCSYTEIKCKHNNCGFFYQRWKLKEHEDSCEYQPATCEHCGVHKRTLKEVKTHYNSCPKFPMSCTNKDHKDFKIQREKLQYHLDFDCPFQPIDCQFKWAGCNDRPKREDEDQHNATSLQKHLLLLAGACVKLQNENKEMGEQSKKKNEELRDEFKKENEELREQLQRESEDLRKKLESDKEHLRKQLNEATQKLNSLTEIVKKLNHTVFGDLPVTGDENNPVRVTTDCQPVFFFSDNYKFRMSVQFGKFKIWGGHNFEFKVYRDGHRVIPEVTKIKIRSDKCDPHILEINAADLAKYFRAEVCENVYYVYIPGKYKVEDSVSIMKVS
uniref:TRAF-type domain-containing protein n=1 Tax=Amphimedon queenslandica TaxID=400682 RepID=A0A1X7UNM1_AMPQE